MIFIKPDFLGIAVLMNNLLIRFEIKKKIIFTPSIIFF